MAEPNGRPYTSQEIAKLAEQLDAVLNGRPWVVSFSCLMLQSLVMLRAAEERERIDGKTAPESIQGLRAAIEAVLPGLFLACEEGPYEGLRVV